METNINKNVHEQCSIYVNAYLYIPKPGFESVPIWRRNVTTLPTTTNMSAQITLVKYSSMHHIYTMFTTTITATWVYIYRVSIMTSTHNLYAIESTAESPSDIYAQVQRCKTSLTNKDEDNVRTIGRSYDYETVVNHIESTDAHMGFEIDNTDTNLNQNKVQSQVYEEIGFGDEQDNRNEEPYITTYVMNTNSSTDTTGSGNITSSTPRVDDSLISTDPEPVWDNIPESGELDVEHVTTRF